MTEYEISGEPYSQKSGWITHSNELIFQVCSHSVLLPVKANIAQLGAHYSGGFKGGSPPSPLLNIL